MFDYESEIEKLEGAISLLNDVIGELQDCPYFEYLRVGYMDDVYEIQQRLDELYELQNGQWEVEMKEQNRQYEGSRI